MNKRVLVRCGIIHQSADLQEYDKVLTLSQDGPDENVRIKVTNVTAAILRNLSPICRDLLDIAAYVYVADTAISRGGPTDILGTSWSRHFSFYIPVRQIHIWNREDVKSHLESMLAYLTGDQITFHFSDHPGDEMQRYLEFDNFSAFPGADCICLFSGGADSLAGVIKLIQDGKQPLLVSHRSAAILDSRQKNLREALEKEIPGWCFPHISVWVHRINSQPKDFSQRSRSFLFLTLASIVGYELSIPEVVIPENGIVSLNLPRLEQTYGTRASRSSQPKFVALFQELITRVFRVSFSIKNPLLFMTKMEVLKSIADAGYPKLIQESVSCAHTMGQPLMVPHCGICSQCVDRRIASVAAGLEEYDLVERYGVDIFTEDLEGEGRQQAESHVRAAYRYDTMTPDDFVTKHRQVVDALPYLGGTSAETAQRFYETYKRAAGQTLKALEIMVARYSGHIIRGELPPHCLIQLAGSQSLKREICESTAERIASILAEDLPLRFRSTLPASERELQDAAEAALHTAGERIQREGPIVPYSVVRTTPDFSINQSNYPLYIELKLVKDENSLRYAVKTIGLASSYYVDQGAYVLFIVYDTHRWIVDDIAFARQYEKMKRVMVRIIR